MSKIELFYIILLIIFGAIGGCVVRYQLTAERKGPPYYKAWLVYIVGMVFCFVIAASIYEIKNTQLVREGCKWIGITAAAISFFGLILLKSRKKK